MLIISVNVKQVYIYYTYKSKYALKIYVWKAIIALMICHNNMVLIVNLLKKLEYLKLT